MNVHEVICPPGLRRWVVVKAGVRYDGGPGYVGPVCDDADVPGRQVYFSKKAAFCDCNRLNVANPDRFRIEPYKECNVFTKQEFTNKLAEYYERWQDQRKEYVTDLMGPAAHNGIMDLLNFIDPIKFSADKAEVKAEVDLGQDAEVEPTTEEMPAIASANVVMLKGKGVIFMVKPTTKMTVPMLMGLAGKDVVVHGKVYRVINAEHSGKGSEVGLVVQPKT
jgi:hypothetical protein